MIYVTHDQTEAMTMADRIVILNDCKIEQTGTPMEVYTYPASRFVAGFVGSPAMNFLKANITGDSSDKIARLGDGAEVAMKIDVPLGGTYELGIRPEAVQVTKSGGITQARATVVEHLGDRTLIYATLSDGTQITAQDGGRSEVKPGEDVALTFDTTQLHLFDENGRAYHAH